jgi:hypothetical protein
MLVSVAICLGVLSGNMARAESENTTATEPNSATHPQTTAPVVALTPLPPSSTTVGSLPSSNQWLYDRTSAFIYLAYDSLVLKSPNLNISHFTSNLGSTDFKYVSVDSYNRLFNLSSPEGPSFWGKLGIWGEFSAGLGTRDGDLYDNDLHSALPSETASLTTLFGKIGIQLVYEPITWIKPYIGISNTWYAFRHTSSMSGAVKQGGSSYYAPAIGAHIPLTFLGKVSAFGEVQEVNVQTGGSQLFANSTNFNGGLGFSF